MNAKEIVATLKKAGKAQTAAIYKRHGAGNNVFGTLTSEIAKLQKKIKVDHDLAVELWKSGNAEARMLALQVADAAKLTLASAEQMIEDGPVRFVDSYLAALVARSSVAEKAAQKWMKSAEESFREVGYAVFAARLRADAASISDADAAKVLAAIEKEIHRSPNWARRAMNSALISIGVYKPALRKKVIEAAKRIGKVEVDHGETSCKTPDAILYIEKAVQRKGR
jgi:3-methyladenine DNA glycosylase AlkD